MAADQLNKRSKVSNVIRHTSWERQKSKKKKIYHYDLDTKSSISLEWDDKKELVVPKKEQISIARRELTPFLPLVSHSQNVLGDVFAAPPELFELKNLTGLLSYEVWQTHLSVQEREFLTQFLPEGADPHEIAHELLSGNNFCFGNPFPKWGASICSGDCHPDAILHQEQCYKDNKIAYYSELNEYHSKMIGSLQSWKEKWASCVNPENDFDRKILRSRKDFHKSGSSHDNNLQYGPENDFGATSDSCSWDADDNSYSSDNPKLALTNGDAINRISRMDSKNKHYESSGGCKSVARPRKGNKIHRLNIECGDGAKYMSYIKVSKEQHERVKSSMKNHSTSIQPRSLNHVLGNLDSFCVQPYEVFEEEERQKLHEHWLRLSKKDLPAGFENWKNWRSAKWQLTKSLSKEMEDKWKENEESCILLIHDTYNATSDNGLVNTIKDEEQEQSISNLCHEPQADKETNDVLLVSPQDNMKQNDDLIFQSEADDLNATNHETTLQIKHTESYNGSQNFCPMAIDTNNDVLTASDAFPSSLPEYPENIDHADTTTEIWPPVSLPNVYYQQPTSVTHGYPSTSELSLGNHQSILQRRSDGGDSFFYPYANQDRNELLLHSLYKDPISSPYLHEQRLSRLNFHPNCSDAMVGSGQLPRNLCSSLQQPLDQENIFADGVGRGYSVPRQEHLLPINHVQDWPVNGGGVNMPMPSLNRSNNNTGGLTSQNWFADDGWSGGVVPPNQDESLFSVLSQCNGLRSGVSFGSTGAMDQFIQSGNYVGLGRGAVPPMTANAVPPRTARGSGLNYMSGNEVQSVARNNNSLGWINLPRGLQERSWNDKDLG